MSRLRVEDLKDSTHSRPGDHGYVKVRCHPGDGLADSLHGRCNTPKYTLVVFDMFRVFCKPNLTVS